MFYSTVIYITLNRNTDIGSYKLNWLYNKSLRNVSLFLYLKSEYKHDFGHLCPEPVWHFFSFFTLQIESETLNHVQ